MDKNDEIIEKVVNVYFEEPDKTLKEIFKDHTKDFSQDEAKDFYEKIKEIVN